MFNQKAIETYTNFENYDSFLVAAEENGFKLHSDPPHVTFKAHKNLTQNDFKDFSKIQQRTY